MKKTTYGTFTPQMMWFEAAPHTWVAAILPVALAIALAALYGFWDEYTSSDIALLSLALLIISILMQSAVNVFNDYFDYIKGTDTIENCADETDAILVYKNINPKSVLAFGVLLLVVSFLIGIYVMYKAGFVPLVIALIGTAIVAFYSAGKTPISYYPIGEVVSGFVMGSLISFASLVSLTHVLYMSTFIYSLPIAIGIGLIMLTNNTCDIEKDMQAKRQTLPILLGRKNATYLYRILLFGMIVLSAFLFLVALFIHGDDVSVLAASVSALVAVMMMFLLSYPALMGLLKNPFLPSTRAQGMAHIAYANVVIGLTYCASLLVIHAL